jgi:hypothetical protein
MPTMLAGPDGSPASPEPPKRPWTTPRLVIHGTMSAQTFGGSTKKKT